MKKTPPPRPPDRPEQLREQYENALADAIVMHEGFNVAQEQIEETSFDDDVILDEEKRMAEYESENENVELALYERIELLRRLGLRTIEDVLPFVAERREKAIAWRAVSNEQDAAMVQMSMAAPGEYVAVPKLPDDHGEFSEEQGDMWEAANAPLLQEMGFELRPYDHDPTRLNPSKARWGEYVFMIGYAKGMSRANPEPGKHGLRGKLIERLYVYKAKEDGEPNYGEQYAGCEGGSWEHACEDLEIQRRIDLIVAAVG